MNYEDCAVLLYNALTANNASGSAYGTTLGFTVSNGQVDGSTILLSSLEGPLRGFGEHGAALRPCQRLPQR